MDLLRISSSYYAGTTLDWCGSHVQRIFTLQGNNKTTSKQVIETMAQNQTPRRIAKRLHSLMDDDDGKKPLIDSTNNYDYDMQPRKKKTCYSHADNLSYKVGDTDSIIKQRTWLYDNIEPPGQDSNIISGKSDNDGNSTYSSSIKKANSNKRKHRYTYDGNTDLVQQMANFENDSTDRTTTKRKRTSIKSQANHISFTLTAAETAETKNKHDQMAEQQTIPFDIPVLFSIVVFIFIFIIFTSYFSSQARIQSSF
ncbi:unnamed protein product [Absidia cylindrospora]